MPPARRLLLSPDYRADPLWDYDTGSMVNLDGLPITEGLRRRVRAGAASWERLAERRMHADDVEAGMLPGPADPPSEAEWTAHGAEMERVWYRQHERPPRGRRSTCSALPVEVNAGRPGSGDPLAKVAGG